MSVTACLSVVECLKGHTETVFNDGLACRARPRFTRLTSFQLAGCNHLSTGPAPETCYAAPQICSEAPDNCTHPYRLPPGRAGQRMILAQLCQRQSQGQLPIFADMAIDEVLQHRRHTAPFKAEAAQDDASILYTGKVVHLYISLKTAKSLGLTGRADKMIERRCQFTRLLGAAVQSTNCSSSPGSSTGAATSRGRRSFPPAPTVRCRRGCGRACCRPRVRCRGGR